VTVKDPFPFYGQEEVTTMDNAFRDGPATTNAPRTLSVPTSVPMSREKVYLLKNAELLLHQGFIIDAAEAVLQSARPASAAQYLVLCSALAELRRRIEDAKKVTLLTP